MVDQPRIAVIGAGLMGHGIAWIFAAAGHRVQVFDPDAGVLKAAPQRIADISELLDHAPGAMDNVTLCTSLSAAVDGVSFAFEAAPENLTLKCKIFADLARFAPTDAVLASNTSALPISQIAKGNKARARIVGTHFWNPPHLVPLVEVVEMEGGNGAAIAPMMNLLREAGRHPVHVRKDVAGFIGNRLQHALKREAIALVANGVCDAETIDDVVKLGFGRRLAVLGPLEQSDLVGLDLTAAIHETLMPDLDRTTEVHPYLLARLEAGDIGMKAGRGFRNWTEETAGAVRSRLAQFLTDNARSQANRKER